MVEWGMEREEVNGVREGLVEGLGYRELDQM